MADPSQLLVQEQLHGGLFAVPVSARCVACSRQASKQVPRRWYDKQILGRPSVAFNSTMFLLLAANLVAHQSLFWCALGASVLTAAARVEVGPATIDGVGWGIAAAGEYAMGVGATFPSGALVSR